MNNIQVAVRVRPLNERERCEREKPTTALTVWKVDHNSESVCEKNGSSSYSFDRVFDMEATNGAIFTEFAQPIVDSVVEGFHGTIFAYGQTASGKTYTMMGEPNAGNDGIIPLALKGLFESISCNPTREFLLRVSYIEIYNDFITDLLRPEKTNLKIMENSQKEVFVVDCTEECLCDCAMALNLLAKGEKNRRFGQTNMNERSSRSHTIFTIVVESRERLGDSDEKAVKVAKLNLVDLAGSERVAQTGAEGIRLKEGGFINKSLFHLGNVIHKLSERDTAYIPFRESKLTRILQTSLGGNALTRIICTVSPAAIEETHSTLRFASRAKTIENNAHVNEVLSDAALLRRYRKEIKDLQRDLEETGICQLKSENERLALQAQQMAKESKESNEQQAQLEAKIKHLERFVLSGRKETWQQGKLKPKSKTVLRRQTLCPAMLMRHHVEEMEPLDEIEEQDAGTSSISTLADTLPWNSVRELTPPSTGESAIEQQVSPCSVSLGSAGSNKDADNCPKVAELEQLIKTLQEALSGKELEVEETLSQWKEQAQQVYIGEVNKLEELISTQKEQLASLEAENKDWKESYQLALKRAEQSNKIQDELDSQEAVVKDLEYQLSESKKQILQMNEENERLVQDLDTEERNRKCKADERYEQLKAQVKEMEAERLDLQKQLQTASMDKEVAVRKAEKEHCSHKLQAALNTAEQSDRIQEELERQESVMKDLEHCLSESNQRISEMTEEKERLVQDLEAEKQERCETDERYKELKEKVKKLEEERDGLQQQSQVTDSDHEAAVRKAEKEMEDLSQNLEAAIKRAQESERLQDELESLQDKFEGQDVIVKDLEYRLKESKKHILEMSEENSRLVEDLETEKQERCKTDECHEQLKVQMKEMEDAKDELQQQLHAAINDKEETVKKVEKEIDDWSGKLQAALKRGEQSEGLQNDLESRATVVKHLECQLTESRKQISEMTEEKGRLVQHFEDEKQGRCEANERYMELKGHMTEVKEEINALQLQLQVASSDKEEAVKKADEMMAQEQKRLVTDKALEREIQELKLQLREAVAHGSDMDFERNEVASNLEEMREQFNAKVKCQGDQIEQLVCEAQQSASEMKKFRTDCEAQRDRLERQLLEARREIEALRADNSKEEVLLDVERLRSQLTVRNEEYDSLCQQMAGVEIQVVELSGELEEKDRELQELEKIKIVGLQQYGRVTTQLEKVQSERELLAAQMTQKEEKAKEVEGSLLEEIRLLKKQLEDCTRDHSETEALKCKVKELEKEKADSFSSRDKIRRELNRVKKECDEMEDELESLQQQHNVQDELRAEMSDLENQNSDLKEKLERIERSEKEQGEEISTLTENMERLEKENTELSEKKELVVKKYWQLKREFDTMEEELEKLQRSDEMHQQDDKQEVDELKSQLLSLRKELDSVKEQALETNAKYREKKGVLTNEIKLLREQLASSNQALETLLNERKAEAKTKMPSAPSGELDGKLCQLHDKLEQRETQLRELRAKYNDLEGKVKVDFDSRLAQATKQLNMLQSENQHLRSELHSKKETGLMAGDWRSNASEAAAYGLRLQRDKLKLDLEEATKKCDKAEKKAMRSEHEARKYQKRMKELEYDNLTLKRQLNSTGIVAQSESVLNPMSSSNRHLPETRSQSTTHGDLSGRREELSPQSTANSKPDPANNCKTQ